MHFAVRLERVSELCLDMGKHSFLCSTSYALLINLCIVSWTETNIQQILFPSTRIPISLPISILTLGGCITPQTTATSNHARMRAHTGCRRLSCSLMFESQTVTNFLSLTNCTQNHRLGASEKNLDSPWHKRSVTINKVLF